MCCFASELLFGSVDLPPSPPDGHPKLPQVGGVNHPGRTAKLSASSVEPVGEFWLRKFAKLGIPDERDR